MSGFINRVDNVIWPSQRDSSADILSVTAKRMEIAILAKMSEKAPDLPSF